MKPSSINPMKPSSLYCLVFFTLLLSGNVFSQTFTMGKKCRASLEVAQSALAQYNEALSYFDTFRSKCKTKDAKEVGAYGKAEALNKLERYNEAIVEADKALDISKNTSLNGYFQKATALSKLGRDNESKIALEQILKLTENNENVTQRASNYALMAAFYERKMNDINSAQKYLDKAKSLDANNIDYIIQEGGMYASQGNYERAFKSYDSAVNLDGNSKDLYIARSNARIKQLDSKYGTTKAQDLRNKMTNLEKTNLCAELTKAIELGYKDMRKELFKALICK